MLSKQQIDEIGAMLGANYGKIFNVKFVKADGSIRTMNARQGIKQGGTPLKGGKWAGGKAKATDYNLVLCTDLEKEREGKHSRRSFRLESVKYLKIGGEVFEV